MTSEDNENGIDRDAEDRFWRVCVGGQFGPYQRRVVLIVGLISFSTAFNNLGYVFWAGRPTWFHCISGSASDYKQMPSENSSLEYNDDLALNLTIPWEKSTDGTWTRSRCHAYSLAINGSESQNELWNEVVVRSTNVTVDCKRWRYDSSQYKSTIVTLWNLVCSSNWLVAFTQSVYMAGRIVGTQLYGHFLDRFGRRLTLLVSTSLEVVFAISCALVDNVYLFLALRFLLGIQTTGELQAAVIIVSEIVGPSYRMLATTVIQLYWALAYMLLAGIAFALRDRMDLHLAISVPLIALPVVFYWIVPETPRWLQAKGRSSEAVAVVRMMAKSNGVDLPDEATILSCSFNAQREETKAESRCNNIGDLFTSINIRRTTIILVYMWFVNSFVFYGLSLSATSLGGNDYINFFISGAVEIPAHIAYLLTVERFGRTGPLALTMTLAGLVLLVVSFIPSDLLALKIALNMVGKASITYSYALIYLYTPEVYPTVIRGIGLGVGTMMSRVGGVVAPFVADLGSSSKSLPFLLFGGFAVLAGLLTAFLAETRGIPLMQTIPDGEKFLRQTAITKLWIRLKKKKATAPAAVINQSDGQGMKCTNTRAL